MEDALVVPLAKSMFLPSWKAGSGAASQCWGRYVLKMNSDSLTPPHLQACPIWENQQFLTFECALPAKMSTACHPREGHNSVVAHQTNWSVFIKRFDIPDERTVYKCPIHLGYIQLQQTEKSSPTGLERRIPVY